MIAARTCSALIVLLWAMGIAACGSTSQNMQSAQAELLKNWTLCRCLAKSAVSEEAREDATKSAAAYLEAGTSGIETYERLEGLVAARLLEHRSGSVEASYNTMKCIDLFRSPELASVTAEAANAGHQGN